jgi:hypothetical protein
MHSGRANRVTLVEFIGKGGVNSQVRMQMRRHKEVTCNFDTPRQIDQEWAKIGSHKCMQEGAFITQMEQNEQEKSVKNSQNKQKEKGETLSLVCVGLLLIYLHSLFPPYFFFSPSSLCKLLLLSIVGCGLHF